MSAPDTAYLILRFALAAFSGLTAGVTLHYALRAKQERRRWNVGAAGGALLIVAAILSLNEGVHYVVTPHVPAPIRDWLWLLGFDLLLPIWALQLVHAWKERDRAEAALSRLAFTDLLTGVLNRRGFIGEAIAALAQARRSTINRAVIVFDIDDFKAINDGFGHDAGDVVLRSLAAVTTTSLRSGSVFGRVGGDEFALLLIGVDLDQAAAAAERIRADIRRGVPHPAGAAAVVTVSAGVAAVAGTGEPEVALTAALAAADVGLYEAKDTGRDRVVISRKSASAVR